MEQATQAAESGSGKLKGAERSIPMMRRRKSSAAVLNLEEMVSYIAQQCAPYT
jgi:hypothetical protein